jgi:hypothetical protein
VTPPGFHKILATRGRGHLYDNNLQPCIALPQEKPAAGKRIGLIPLDQPRLFAS